MADGVFRTRPDWSLGSPSLPFEGYRLSLLGVKQPGRGVNHPPPSNAVVKAYSCISMPPMDLHGLLRHELKFFVEVMKLARDGIQ